MDDGMAKQSHAEPVNPAGVADKLLIKCKIWFIQLAFIQKFIESIDFSLPLQAWNNSKQVIYSILLSSMFINILSLAFPMALLQVYDRIIPNVAYQTLVMLLIGVGIALLFEFILKMARSYVSGWADARFEHITGCNMLDKLLKSPLLQYEKEGSGVYLKKLSALNQLREFYSGQVVTAIADLPYIFLLVFLIYYIGSWVVLVPITTLIILLITTVYHASGLEFLLNSRMAHDDRRMNFIIESIGHIHTIKSVAMEAQMLRRYERLQKVSSVYDYEVSLNGAGTMVLGLSLAQITIILVAVCGSILVIHGKLTMGGLAACTLLSGRCLQPINMLVGVWTRLQSVKIATDDIKSLLALKPERAELPKIPVVKGKLELKNMCFQYNKDTILFNDANLVVEANEAIGITGDGQCGKSTLAWLITNVIAPTSGKVIFDKYDTAKFDIESVRRKVAYLPQKRVLFNGTIMENLTMFQVDEFYQKAKTIAKLLGLAEVIEKLPEGYETMVANSTTEALPQGITQRIVLARPLLYNAPIVIFDEANLGIDMHGDDAIRKLLERIKGRCTLILISHRPSILKLADKQYSIKDKKLRLIS